MVAKIKSLWNSLSAAQQAAITTFGSAFIATLAHAIDEGGCLTAICLRHYLRTAIITAAVTLKAFYMQPGSPAIAAVSDKPIAPALPISSQSNTNQGSQVKSNS
jgi:hypothetical protein